ncbi:MAG: extracellular solute-binding protein [Oscillospiraceae bacterium]|nr:extracellular solute-binding protein [Oscillospiraceae bacterium]
MKTVKAKKKTLAALLILILLFIAACSPNTQTNNSGGGNSATGNAADNGGISAESTIEAESYDYPALDCGGRDFTFLNPIQDWGFYTNIVLESQTGEVLDDAVYARNQTVEDKFNMNLKEINFDIGVIEQKIKTTVLAGDSAYDIMYCPAYNNASIGALITQNLFYNLKDIPELQLDKPWWNQDVQEECSIGAGNKSYFAVCDVNIMDLQVPWCVYFNEDMMGKLGLDLPYSLVKDGKWTYDRLAEYAKAGAQLNGATTFDWDHSNAAVYGLTAWEHGMGALLAASGERYVSKDQDGNPYFTADTERFLNACDKISQMTGQKGVYLSANDWPNEFNYQYIFRDGKAMLMIGELKAADSLRDVDSTWGILPLPKYDETQSRYYSPVTIQMPVLTVPITNSDTHTAGVILDAMAYLSSKDVTPVFFDVTMSQKRLRDDESIEMLQIIKDSVIYDLGMAYGWSTNLYLAIRTSLDTGKNDAATIIDKNKDKINTDMAKTMALMN